MGRRPVLKRSCANLPTPELGKARTPRARSLQELFPLRKDAGRGLAILKQSKTVCAKQQLLSWRTLAG
jgi:hypothetical protein